MRVLLTGGTGFVGHHVADHLLETTDWELVILDSLSYAGDPSRLLSLPSYDPERVTVVYHDLRAAVGQETAEKIGEVGVILNLASASHVERSIADPVPFVQNNVAVALNALEFARQVKPKMFVQFSTDEVFGPAQHGEAFGEWDRHIPSNPYAASKSAQEAIAISYWRTFGVPVVITNTMNIFGERQHPEKFVPLCAAKVRAGEAIPIHAEHTEEGWVPGSRYWLYAKDAADALRFLIEHAKPEPYPVADRPMRFNIVGADEYANTEIAAMVATALKLPFRFEMVDFHSTRPGHDRRYALDGAQLAACGWKPTIGVEEGIWRSVR